MPFADPNKKKEYIEKYYQENKKRIAEQKGIRMQKILKENPNYYKEYRKKRVSHNREIV